MSKAVKLVRFADDSKSYDGTVMSPRNIIFYKIVCGFFKAKFFDETKPITSACDILHITDFNYEMITYCKHRLIYFLKLLIEKKKIQQYESTFETPEKEKDLYWDSDFFKSRIRPCGYKVSLVRRGCRDFNLSFSISNICHIENLLRLIIQAQIHLCTSVHGVKEYFKTTLMYLSCEAELGNCRHREDEYNSRQREEYVDRERSMTESMSY